MSDSARPEITAFRELATLVHHLADELAGFRRRALVAEARVKELEGQVSQPARQQQRHLGERVSQLEQENAALRERLDSATARTAQMLDRVRFIRQQAQGGSER
jgi:methyl-accepting chemotaxis protein